MPPAPFRHLTGMYLAEVAKSGEGAETYNATIHTASCQKLQEAIVLHPAAIGKLQALCGDGETSTWAEHPLFTHTCSQPAVANLHSLFAERCADFWKRKDIQTWVESTVTQTLRGVSEGTWALADVRVQQEAVYDLPCFEVCDVPLRRCRCCALAQRRPDLLCIRPAARGVNCTTTECHRGSKPEEDRSGDVQAGGGGGALKLKYCYCSSHSLFCQLFIIPCAPMYVDLLWVRAHVSTCRAVSCSSGSTCRASFPSAHAMLHPRQSPPPMDSSLNQRRLAAH